MKSPNTYNILIIYLKSLKIYLIFYFLLIIYLNRDLSILQVVLLLKIHLQYIYYILILYLNFTHILKIHLCVYFKYILSMSKYA
jgi:hypothetical protein